MDGALALSAAIGMTVIGGSAAYAYRDSGVAVRGCSGQYGVLEARQSGVGNSWAPGDWTGGFINGQHNAHGSTLTWMADYQNYGTGGGSYRIVTDNWYDSLRTRCSNVGLL